jgi:F0F1-type ATP synthase membrane subunit b/b'
MIAMVNWDDLLKTLGSTAIVVAVLGFLAKTIIDHFFSRALETHKNNLKEAADKDVESHKAELKREADSELANARARTERELAEAKARSDHELAELRARTDHELVMAKERADAALLAQKAQFDRQMANFQTGLAIRTAREDRIRQQVVHWANPIFGAVVDLERRLDNILQSEGYLALSPDTEGKISTDWSICYDYFLPSTVYLFCQYFCWIRLLQESLSFELFEKHEAKDDFFEGIRAVGHKLSGYPLDELKDLPHGGDCQIFNLQQRAIGEAATVREGSELRCMRYPEFLVKWPDPDFKRLLDPMTRFVDKLQPTNARRWKRLDLMAEALKNLQQKCKQLLTPKGTQ